MIRCWGFGGSKALAILCLFGLASKRKGAGRKEWESQGYYRRRQIQLRVINNFLY